MNIRTKLVSLTSTVALATLTAIGGAGAAQAATTSTGTDATASRPVHSATVATSAGYATLYVYDFNDGNYWITVSGKANLASVPPGNMYITLYADDTWFDDNIFDTNWLSTNPDGSFYIEFPLCCSALDEDWGQDEVYAKVRAWNAPGGGNVTLTTNTVNGSF
jgi:hypothetical protein